MSKRIFSLLCLTFSASLLPGAAFAQDQEVVAVHGFDRMSCEDWLASRDDEAARALYVAWIRGIVTGYNFANPDNQVALGRMPGDFSLGMFVDSYCRAHRGKPFTGAAFDLIEQKRGNSGFTVIPTDPDSGDDGFDAWLKRQSPDMRSLDPALLRSIYKRETALKSGK